MTDPGKPERAALTDERLAQTRVAASFSIGPIGNVAGDVAGLLGDSHQQLLGMFYPPRICRKADVVITELVTNVFENMSDPESEMKLEVRVDPERLVIRVVNRATEEQFRAVKGHLERITASESPTKLLATTLRERRVHRLKGGLGLMRLVAENKFRVSASYEQGHLAVQAEFPLKDVV